MYLTVTGSVAYGVSDDHSDVDIYGVCIPPKTEVFPHLAGNIEGFGKQRQRFESWQEHHIKDPSNDKEYDFQVYGIVKYFQLCMENNPNMIDTLFTPRRCVIHATQLSELIRENRKLFLHKGCWHKFKGYSFSQLHKMRGQKREGKRKDSYEKFGFDVKFGLHVVRLLLEVEQILAEGDLDLERHREQLKAIRRGEWTEPQIRQWAQDKEKDLEKLYNESTALPYKPDEAKIKELLLNCLEIHYGSLSECLVKEDRVVSVIKNIRTELDRIKDFA